MAKPQSRRGDVVSHPYELAVGDTLVVIDRQRALENLPPVMARIAILSFHNTTETRLRHAGITKRGPGDPNHFHGIMSLVTPPEEDDGQPATGFEVLISTENESIVISQRSGSDVPDMPADPLFMMDNKV